jgi:membrane protein required for beta-lactamase induction
MCFIGGLCHRHREAASLHDAILGGKSHIEGTLQPLRWTLILQLFRRVLAPQHWGMVILWGPVGSFLQLLFENEGLKATGIRNWLAGSPATSSDKLVHFT